MAQHRYEVILESSASILIETDDPDSISDRRDLDEDQAFDVGYSAGSPEIATVTHDTYDCPGCTGEDLTHG